jgi:hypothetical protein
MTDQETPTVRVHIAEGLVVRPGDTLVLRLDEGVDVDEALEVKAAIERGMPPGVQVGVIVADGQLAVVRAAQPDPRPLAPLPASQPIGGRRAPADAADAEGPR